MWSWSGPGGLEPYLEVLQKQDHPITALKSLPGTSSAAFHLLSTNVKGEMMLSAAKEGAEGLNMEVEVEVQLGSGAPLTSVDVQGDRNHVLVAGEDGKFWIWDATADRMLQQGVQASESALNAAKWISPDSFVVASHASECHVWDLRESHVAPVRTLKEHVNAHAVVDRKIWSLDSNPARPWLIASAVSGPSQELRPTIMFHDLRAAPQPVLVNASLHLGHIWKVAFHPDHPDHIISSSDDGTLLQWDTSSAFESTSNLKPASIGQRFQNSKENNVKCLRNDGLPINSFEIDTAHNLVISTSDAESITFNTELF